MKIQTAITSALFLAVMSLPAAVSFQKLEKSSEHVDVRVTQLPSQESLTKKKTQMAVEVASISNAYYEHVLSWAQSKCVGDADDLPYIISLVEDYSQLYNLDFEIVMGLIDQESQFLRTARSHMDCVGLMQISEDTLTEFNRKSKTGHTYSFDQMTMIQPNIEVGCWYLSFLINQYDMKETYDYLLAYNVGPNSKQITKYPENVIAKKNELSIFYEG